MGFICPMQMRGVALARVGARERGGGNSKVVILEINGKQIAHLDDFIDACMAISDGQHTYMVVRDFNLFDSSPTPKSVTINPKFGPLQVFEWNEQQLDWEPVEIEKD